jgi:hypothetical protein
MSVFYDSRFTVRFPVPLLFFEWVSKNPTHSDATDQEIINHYTYALKFLRVHPNPSQEDLQYVLDRLVKTSATGDGRKTSPVKGFGHALREMLEEMDTQGLLLAACGFDYAKARHVYCELDRDEALHIVNTYVKLMSHHHSMAYEAGVYASGGAYKDSENTEVIDMTKPVDLDTLNMMFNA